MVNKDRISAELNLKHFGGKGWLSSRDVVCSQCGKSDKTGILFSGKGGIFNCMRCGVSYGLNKFLKKINKYHLIDFEYEVSIQSKLKPLFVEKEEQEEEIQLPIKKLPIGFRRLQDDEYLNNRGFLQYHYDLFEPGYTKIDLSRKHTIIFKIFDEEKRLVGWLARSKKNKEWHNQNITNHKEKGERLILRYDNSPNTDFSHMLGGIKKITDKTDTIIIVEGLFDAVNVDKELQLDTQEDIKTLFTFGDAIKQPQIDILKKYKNIKNIYLMYDYNTIANSKRYGLILKEELGDVNINVCEINLKDKDPGNLTRDEIFKIIDKSVDAMAFKYKKLTYVIQRK